MAKAYKIEVLLLFLCRRDIERDKSATILIKLFADSFDKM